MSSKKARRPGKTALNLCNNPNEADQIQRIRKLLKRQILCPEVKFRHHVKERTNLLELLKRTVENGESNSALILGPRGSGKTTLINSILKELSNSEAFNDNAIIVNLNGLVHTDDRLALKDATRQMQLENVVGDKVFGTFAENLNFLFDCLKSGDRKHSKPVIFILDEFDLFCAHNNQTLLYNLFDVAQSAQAPICVIGITSRIDVIELLEKRVKSRFSHRQIFIFPKDDSVSEKSASLDELFTELLSFPTDENVNQTENIRSDFINDWNRSIEELASNSEMKHLIKHMNRLDINERHFRYYLAAVVATLSENHTSLTVKDFIDAKKMFNDDAKTIMLEELSILELSLVIAMKHEIELFGDEPINFEVVFNRYMQFAGNARIESVHRPVIMKAFEHLRTLEIIIPVSGNQRVEKEYQLYNFVVRPDQVTKAVNNYQNLPTDVLQWAQSSII